MKKQIVFTSAMGQQIYAYTEGETYVASPGDAPKGTALKRGPRGGYYYEEPAGKGSEKEQPLVSTKGMPDWEKKMVKKAREIPKALDHVTKIKWDTVGAKSEDEYQAILKKQFEKDFPSKQPDKEQGTKEPDTVEQGTFDKDNEYKKASDEFKKLGIQSDDMTRKMIITQLDKGHDVEWMKKHTDIFDTVEQGTKEEPEETFYRYDEPVRIHPDLTTDPAGKQGEWGTIKDIKKDYIVVKFRDGTTGKYEPDALMGNGEEEQ